MTAHGSIAQRDESPERHTAENNVGDPGCIEDIVQVPNEHVEVCVGIKSRVDAWLSGQRRRNDPALTGQRIDGRRHPFPPSLNSRNEHQWNPRTHIDHQFLNVLPVFSVYWIRSSVFRSPHRLRNASRSRSSR